MHHPPCLGVERIAPVHGGAVVPEHEVAQRPLVLVDSGVDVSPDFVEQTFRFRNFEPDDVSDVNARNQLAAAREVAREENLKIVRRGVAGEREVLLALPNDFVTDRA